MVTSMVVICMHPFTIQIKIPRNHYNILSLIVIFVVGGGGCDFVTIHDDAFNLDSS